MNFWLWRMYLSIHFSGSIDLPRAALFALYWEAGENCCLQVNHSLLILYSSNVHPFCFYDLLAVSCTAANIDKRVHCLFQEFRFLRPFPRSGMPVSCVACISSYLEASTHCSFSWNFWSSFFHRVYESMGKNGPLPLFHWRVWWVENSFWAHHSGRCLLWPCAFPLRVLQALSHMKASTILKDSVTGFHLISALSTSHSDFSHCSFLVAGTRASVRIKPVLNIVKITVFLCCHILTGQR